MKTTNLILIAVLILLSGNCITYSQNRNPLYNLERKEPVCNFTYIDSAGLDSFITAQMTEYHIPGVSACIVKRGRIIWTGNYGWAYINPAVPVYDSTLFQIASISKTVTGAALMKLFERGRFGLDDSINAYLPFRVINPYFPDSVITFRMLLTHTSSIKDNWSNMPYFFNINSGPQCSLGDYLDDYFTPDSVFYSLSNFNNFTPGSTWQYCNMGYALIGYLVETITGVDFNEYCKDSIFTRLSMSESSFFYSDLDTMHMAMPYRYNANYIPYNHYYYFDYPDGMLKTSTIQLARFLIAFMQNGLYQNARILDSTTVRLILTPQIPLISPGQGLTWMRVTFGSRVLWGHGGGDYGIRTRMYFCPDDTTGALLFSNGETNPGYDLILNQMFNFASSYIISVRPISSNVPLHFGLYQNYPNPFNPVTKITFALPKSEDVKLTVFDVLGREVTTLVNEKLSPGTYEVEWDGRKYPSGVYFYRVTTGEFSDTKKMILVK